MDIVFTISVCAITILLYLLIGKWYFVDKIRREAEVKYLSEINNIKLVAFIFILLSIILYITAYFLKTYIHVCPIWTDLLIMVAGSCLTTGAFSVLLGFSDFINYVAKRLTDIVINNSYLDSLSSDKKLDLKKAIDEQIFGNVAVSDSQSLYRFIDQRTGDIFKSPYRTEYHDQYIFKNSVYDDFWSLENHTCYCLREGAVDGSRHSVPFHGGFLIPNEDVLEKDDFFTCIINIGKDKLKTVKTGKAFKLSPDPNNKHLKNDIEITSRISTDNNICKWYIDFDISLPDAMINDYNKSVIVDFTTNRLYYKLDNVVFLTMSYPTKDVFMACEIQDGDFKMQCCAFGFDADSHVIRLSDNSASIDLKEWLLPGHGAVITWQQIVSK